MSSLSKLFYRYLPGGNAAFEIVRCLEIFVCVDSQDEGRLLWIKGHTGLFYPHWFCMRSSSWIGMDKYIYSYLLKATTK